MEENIYKTKLTLNPNEQNSNKVPADVPTMKSIMEGNNISSETEFSAGTIDESMLTDEEKEMVNQFAEEIDISNVEQAVSYGAEAQKNISDFSVSILKKVKTYDLGEVGDSLKSLTIALDATTEPEKKGIRGLFQKAKRGIGAIRANYAKAEGNVDRIEKDLKLHKAVLAQDINMYQQMYELNVQYYKELTMYIIAGKKSLAKAQKGKLEDLKKIAETTNSQENIQNYRDFADLCHRFDKKLADLEITREISIQTAPQVRLLQNNNREMMDKLQSSLANTIPLWRNQLVLSLGIEHSKRALDAQKTLSDKTNELLLKNAETLRMATVESAKEAERPIVDIATLQQCNRNLISSIKDVVKIHEQGVTNREKARVELAKLEEELKQAMVL